jgi:hypothetical protein
MSSVARGGVKGHLHGKSQFCRLGQSKKVPPSNFYLSLKNSRQSLKPKNLAALLYKLRWDMIKNKLGQLYLLNILMLCNFIQKNFFFFQFPCSTYLERRFTF